ncbi:glycoside hydrolase family protein [Pleionea sediminis]|uniref:glycoside hydrolase family protein n=1 Tax=Pleionea sediminis TaxID=2569479 RepID=UPI001184BFD3|nr:glycoside hydrolase family protein [Pleionea sediminis]
MNELKDDLKRDEGFRAYPYECTAGKVTIGYGRNLEDVGISQDEAESLLTNDMNKAINDLSLFNWFNKLNDNRKRAFSNMVFNLGLTRFLKFKHMLSAIERGDFTTAAYEARNSRWYRQVGRRAERIVSLIEKG